MIKGVNVNGKISYEGLMNDMIRYDHLTPERKLMIISDARVRLRMAGEDNKRDNGRAKMEDLKSVSDACAEIQAFSMSPDLLTLVRNRL